MSSVESCSLCPASWKLPWLCEPVNSTSNKRLLWRRSRSAVACDDTGAALVTEIHVNSSHSGPARLTCLKQTLTDYHTLAVWFFKINKNEWIKSFPCTGGISTYVWERSNFCCTRLQFTALSCLTLIVETDGSASCAVGRCRLAQTRGASEITMMGIKRGGDE